MAIKRLKDVQVGSIIPHGGEKFKVVQSTHNSLYVVKQVAPGIYKQDVHKYGVYPEIDGLVKHDSLVYVLEEPKVEEAAASLTSNLRQQVKQQELTSSLKSQLEQADEEAWEDNYSDYEDEEDEDWDEDDEDEDDQYYDYYGGYDAEPNPHTHSYVSPQDGATKADALKANLRAQVAQQGALNASLKAQSAVSKSETAATKALTASLTAQTARREVTELRGQTDQQFARVERWAEEVGEKHNSFVDHVQEEVQDLQDRLSKIEGQQAKEEERMSLERKLNERLALQKQLNESLAKNKKSTIGGNGKMKNLLGAFTGQFGKVEGKFAFSPATNGLAIRKGISPNFVAFDGNEITDVQDFVLKFDVPAFSLPTAAKDVKKGDIVRNGADYGYVTRVNDGFVEVVNVEKNARGSVLPTKNILMGQSFYTVIKTLDSAGQGGFDPMLLMALGKGDTDELLPFLLMSGGLGGDAAKAGAINPMMLMALKDKASDLLPFLLMQQGGVMGEGFNPLMLLALGDDKDGKGSDLLPLMMMSGGFGGAAQGGQAGAMNPMMMMALAGDGDIDITTLALMGGFNGQGGLFGGQAPKADVKAPESK